MPQLLETHEGRAIPAVCQANEAEEHTPSAWAGPQAACAEARSLELDRHMPEVALSCSRRRDRRRWRGPRFRLRAWPHDPAQRIHLDPDRSATPELMSPPPVPRSPHDDLGDHPQRADESGSGFERFGPHAGEDRIAQPSLQPRSGADCRPRPGPSVSARSAWASHRVECGSGPRPARAENHEAVSLRTGPHPPIAAPPPVPAVPPDAPVVWAAPLTLPAVLPPVPPPSQAARRGSRVQAGRSSARARDTQRRASSPFPFE